MQKIVTKYVVSSKSKAQKRNPKLHCLYSTCTENAIYTCSLLAYFRKCITQSVESIIGNDHGMLGHKSGLNIQIPSKDSSSIRLLFHLLLIGWTSLNKLIFGKGKRNYGQQTKCNISSLWCIPETTIKLLNSNWAWNWKRISERKKEMALCVLDDCFCMSNIELQCHLNNMTQVLLPCLNSRGVDFFQNNKDEAVYVLCLSLPLY